MIAISNHVQIFLQDRPCINSNWVAIVRFFFLSESLWILFIKQNPFSVAPLGPALSGTVAPPTSCASIYSPSLTVHSLYGNESLLQSFVYSHSHFIAKKVFFLVHCSTEKMKISAVAVCSLSVFCEYECPFGESD